MNNITNSNNIFGSYGHRNMLYIMVQLHKVNLHNGPDGKKLQVFDCRGFPRQCGENSAFVKDLEKAIKGHIKDNYQV